MPDQNQFAVGNTGSVEQNIGSKNTTQKQTFTWKTLPLIGAVIITIVVGILGYQCYFLNSQPACNIKADIITIFSKNSK